MIALLGFLTTVVTGCVSQSHYESEVGGLQKHVRALTTQVTQLDTALESAETALKTEREQAETLRAQITAFREQQAKARSVSSTPTPSLSGMYQTPSGFQIPAKDIQSALHNSGYYHGPIDGQIGPASRQAIRDFQSDQGLKVDGVCGQETWEKLKPYVSVGK